MKVNQFRFFMTMDSGEECNLVTEAIVTAGGRVVVMSARRFDERVELPLGSVETGPDGSLSRTEEGSWTKGERLRLINKIREIDSRSCRGAIG